MTFTMGREGLMQLENFKGPPWEAWQGVKVGPKMGRSNSLWQSGPMCQFPGLAVVPGATGAAHQLAMFRDGWHCRSSKSKSFWCQEMGHFLRHSVETFQKRHGAVKLHTCLLDLIDKGKSTWYFFLRPSGCHLLG